MLGGVHHIGYRVSDLEQAVAEYQKLFGSTVVSRTKLANGSPVAFITMGSIQLELMQNTTAPGQHLDHVAYIVDDLDAELSNLKAQGATFESQEPVTSSSGARFMFVNLLGSRIQVYKPAPVR
ncbi:MAG: VOC family protein [Bacteroidetes bacterium]|nr:VOC family protein [Bacteroidota bacterium]MCL5025249.1 VOC family protein [Chloroflexota bacterium]